MKSELLLHVAERWHTVALRPGGKRPLLPGAASTRLPPEARQELLLAGASFAGPLPPPGTRTFQTLFTRGDVAQLMAVSDAADSLTHLNANVGVETGPVSRLAVLDVDPPPIGSPISTYPRVMEIVDRLRASNFIRRAVTTPSGGLHVYVSLTLASDTSSEHLRTLRIPGADLQLRGAYVVTPPSVIRPPDGEGTYVEVSYDASSAPFTLDTLLYLRSTLTSLAPDEATSHGDLTNFPVHDPPDHVPPGRRDEAAFSCAVNLRNSSWPYERAIRYITHVFFPRVAQPPEAEDYFSLNTALAKYTRATDPPRPDPDRYEADLMTLERYHPDVFRIITDD